MGQIIDIGLNTEPPSGFKMFPPIANQGQTNGPVTGAKTYFVPFYVPRVGIRFDRIGIYLNFTAGNAGSLRLGVFDVLAATGLPGAVIVDSGAISYTASFGGEVQATISWTPARIGWFYVSMTLQSAAPATLAGGVPLANFGGNSASNGWWTGVLGKTGESPTNAYSGSPSITTGGEATTAPAIFLRKV